MKRQRLTSILSGIAGQFYVAAEVTRRGYVATITLGNSRVVDVLATNGTGRRAAAIQVKCNQDSEK